MMLDNDSNKKKYNDDFMTPYSSRPNSYASLDDAFRQPAAMVELQQKNNNDIVENDYNLLTPQTEDKINYSVDQMMTTDRDMLSIYEESIKLPQPESGSKKNMVANRSVPLMNRIENNTLGITTIPNYNNSFQNTYIPTGQYFYENIYPSPYSTMNIFKFIVILILLIALIYGCYFLYKKYDNSSFHNLETSNVNISNNNISSQK